jgi:hypothetical protein
MVIAKDYLKIVIYKIISIKKEIYLQNLQSAIIYTICN